MKKDRNNKELIVNKVSVSVPVKIVKAKLMNNKVKETLDKVTVQNYDKIIWPTDLDNYTKSAAFLASNMRQQYMHVTIIIHPDGEPETDDSDEAFILNVEKLYTQNTARIEDATSSIKELSKNELSHVLDVLCYNKESKALLLPSSRISQTY